MARIGPQKRVLRPKGADIKTAVARATARSEGKPIPPRRPEAKIDPPIITKEEIAAEVHVIVRKEKAKAIRRRRRTGYTPALGRAICKMMAMGLTIRRICARPFMPHERTVWAWIATPGHPFYQHYARARESYYLRMADDIVEIADDSSSDWKEESRGKDAKPVKVVDREHLDRAKLRIETRKWLLSKVMPRLFGDQAEQGADDQPGAPLDVTPRDGPKPTGRDHLDGMAQRYALNGAKAIKNVPVTIEGKSSRH